MMDAGVVFEDVTVRIANVGTILGPVSWRVGRGERWAVLGPNGSGKTTALSVAGAWRHPSSGRAWVLGKELGAVDVRRLREGIGHVGHTIDELIRPALRVRDVVLTGRSSTLETWWQSYTTTERAEADDRLATVGCAQLADRPLGTCSQGERARVLLARALFIGRDLILFDEPAAGLDLPARERLVTAMDATATADGPSSILATHHLEEIPSTTTHAALLRGGRLLTDGPVEEVLTDEALGDAFGLAVRVERRGGRWTAFAPGG